MAQQSIIDFLQLAGFISSDDIRKCAGESIAEPSRLVSILMAQGILASDILRNALRLRYWMKLGFVDFETAANMLNACTLACMDVEDYVVHAH